MHVLHCFEHSSLPLGLLRAFIFFYPRNVKSHLFPCIRDPLNLNEQSLTICPWLLLKHFQPYSFPYLLTSCPKNIVFQFICYNIKGQLGWSVIEKKIKQLKRCCLASAICEKHALELTDQVNRSFPPHMEHISRRRWWLAKIQLSNIFGYYPSILTVFIVLAFYKRNSLPLGQIWSFISLY